MQITKRLSIPLDLGPPTTLCCDPRRLWVVVGTLNGYLTLWDMRFGILLRKWRVGSGGRVRQVVVHPSKGGGRCIVAASEGTGGGQNESTEATMETWSIDTGKVVEIFQVGGKPSSAPATSAPAPLLSGDHGGTVEPAQAIAALFDTSSLSSPLRPSSAPERPSPTILAVVPGPISGASRGARSSLAPDGWNEPSEDSQSKGGYLWTGGEDRALRRLDLGSFAKSAIFGASPTPPSPDVAFRFVLQPCSSALCWYRERNDLLTSLFLSTARKHRLAVRSSTWRLARPPVVRSRKRTTTRSWRLRW